MSAPLIGYASATELRELAECDSMSILVQSPSLWPDGIDDAPSTLVPIYVEPPRAAPLTAGDFTNWDRALFKLIDAHIQEQVDGDEGAGDETYNALKAHLRTRPTRGPTVAENKAVLTNREVEEIASRFALLAVESKHHNEDRLAVHKFARAVEDAVIAKLSGLFAYRSGRVAQSVPAHESQNILVRIAGKSYRCPCGCNVFHKPDQDRPDLYACNGCNTMFEGE